MIRRSFEEKTKYQFTRWARVYDSPAFRIYFEPLYQRLEILLAQKLNTRSGNGDFLDVACGTGEIIIRLARKYPQVHFTGIDLTPAMVIKAKEKRTLLSNVDFCEANIDQLPFENESFDIILCSEAFHHFPEPARATSEMYRVLKKGGYLFLMDPAFDTWWQKILIAVVGYFDFAERCYSQTELSLLLQNAGFKKETNFVYRLNNFYIVQKS